MDMRDHLKPEQIKEVMKMADREDAKPDAWETFLGIAMTGICISVAAAGCVYVANHLKNPKKHIAKQEQISTVLMKNKQIEFQK